MPTHSSASHTDPRIAFFDEHATHWDDDPVAQAHVRERLRELRPLLGFQAGWDVLEAGCGTGQITDLLAEWVRPGRVTAVDFSAVMLARARAKGIAADFREVDICRTPPALRAYDLALCFQSFPHFRDPHAALRHLAAALRPHGRLMILHLAGSAEVNAFHRQVGGAVGGDHLPAPAEWPARLESAGLCLVRCVDRPDLFLVEAKLLSRTRT
jgi:SAM-dependent methyltransferase